MVLILVADTLAMVTASQSEEAFVYWEGFVKRFREIFCVSNDSELNLLQNTLRGLALHKLFGEAVPNKYICF